VDVVGELAIVLGREPSIEGGAEDGDRGLGGQARRRFLDAAIAP
jgi:hypothetical protein